MGYVKKVLVVDDDPTTTHLLSSTLKTGGFDVQVANDGQDGLEKCRQSVFDLIILDVEMPVMDGYSFLVDFRQIDYAGSTPIVMLTAKDAMEDVFRAEGVQDYIVKPIDGAKFNEIIEKYLNTDQGGS